MPVLVNKQDQPVAFRCERHRDVPVLNLNAQFTEGKRTECGVCCLDQAADALLKDLGELIDKAAKRLEFFEPGTGDQLRQQAAEYINSLSATTPQTDDAAKETP